MMTANQVQNGFKFFVAAVSNIMVTINIKINDI